MDPRNIRCAVTALLTAALLLGVGASHADEDIGQLPDAVQKTLRRYRMAPEGLSVYVRVLGQPAPLLAVRADTPRNPASTMKLLTTLVALEELGPAYTWKTEAYTRGRIRDGRLDGDLYIKGYGDPYLVIEHFWRYLRALRNIGIDTIAGDLVLDLSYFTPDPGDPNDFDGRGQQAYNVKPSALLLNFQAVSIRFFPDPGANRVVVSAEPPSTRLTIDNRLRLTRGGCRGWNRNLGLRVVPGADSDRLVVSGSYAADCGANELYRVLSEQAAYVLGVFQSVWAELGGRIEGGVREEPVPADAKLLHTGYSPPLAEMLRSINKYSNNVMTRQLLLTLGAEKLEPPGSTDKGIRVLRGWLARHGLDFPELVLENGAGLSREERISARHLGQVLEAGYESPYMPEFLSSLPVLAMDGTLEKRLTNSPMAGKAHLKTGTLNDVRAVAGVMRDATGRRLIVTALQNDARADGPGGEALQNALLEWLYARP